MKFKILGIFILSVLFSPLLISAPYYCDNARNGYGFYYAQIVAVSSPKAHKGEGYCSYINGDSYKIPMTVGPANTNWQLFGDMYMCSGTVAMQCPMKNNSQQENR